MPKIGNYRKSTFLETVKRRKVEKREKVEKHENTENAKKCKLSKMDIFQKRKN